jgi:hypothetical protein
MVTLTVNWGREGRRGSRGGRGLYLLRRHRGRARGVLFLLHRHGDEEGEEVVEVDVRQAEEEEHQKTLLNL